MRPQQLLLPLLLLYLALFPCAAEPPQSLDALTPQARQGNPDAQAALALRFREGDGVKTDLTQTLHWAHLAARQLAERAASLDDNSGLVLLGELPNNTGTPISTATPPKASCHAPSSPSVHEPSKYTQPQ